MRIAILSPFYPYRGGIAQFSGRLYEALQTEHEVKAFSFARLYPDFLFPGKTQYEETPDASDAFRAERLLDSIEPWSYGRTAKAIAAFQPDVLIIAYWMSFFAPALSAVARRLKKKTRIVGLLHNALPHEPMFFDRPLAKVFFRQCERFVVLSEAVKNDLLALRPDANYLLRAHPIYDHYGHKLPQASAQHRLGLDPKLKTLLFFGLIRDYKGLDLLIEAMAHLDDSYQLLIAGETYGSFDKYQALLDASPARERIRHLDCYIDNQEVPTLFSAADVLVLPYKSATQSGVIPVAYHFETPVVTTDVGGLKNAVEGAQTGVVCRPEATAIARGIDRLFAQGKDAFVAHIQSEKKKLSWENFARDLTGFLV
jgi:glycosyltransferase involved in cell wall biosynthesis